MKGKEQEEALDGLFRQSIMFDPFHPFTKSGDSPLQWIQLFDTIDQQSAGLKIGSLHNRRFQTSGSPNLPEPMVAIAQQAAEDLPDWPLVSNGIQMKKCEKCSQEYCSPLNLRRHVKATHRRSLNADKEDLRKTKEQVGFYWDKLSLERASEVVSSKTISISLQDLSASSVVETLTTQLQHPNLLNLQQPYFKAASTLLGIVQSKSSAFPLSSAKLFNILEDASEKNLFCGITSSSMQRCIFDNEPGKVGLETTNLVASLGFLLELNLVKAWMDAKDMEALRCQKALVEEEEAAQKRQAMLQERKRQKKMRQKESKDKERSDSEPSSSLQTLKLDSCSNEVKNRAEQGDSPVATLSTPSSSVYSCQDVHTSEIDVCKGHKKGSNGVTTFQPEAPPNDVAVEEDCSDSRYARFHTFQKPDFDYHGDYGRSCGQIRSQNWWKYGGDFGWRERRQSEHSENPVYNSCNSMRYYNDYHSYGALKTFRRPCYMASVSASEYGGSYGQQQSRCLGVKRSPCTETPSHAVWARKVPQPLVSEQRPDGDLVEGAGGNISMELSMGIHSVSEEEDKTFDLSCYSSISVDSASSYSSSGLCARVGVEEQRRIHSSVISSCHRTLTSQGDNQPVVLCEGFANGAVIIGSMTISLGDAWFGSKDNLVNASRNSIPETSESISGNVGEDDGAESHSFNGKALVLDTGIDTVHSSVMDADDVCIRVKQSQFPSMPSKLLMHQVWRPTSSDELEAHGVSQTETVELEVLNNISSDSKGNSVYRAYENGEQAGCSVLDGFDGGSVANTNDHVIEQDALHEGSSVEGINPYSLADITCFLSQRWASAILSSNSTDVAVSSSGEIC